MDDVAHGAAAAGELRGERVDEERHVVGDDLDDRPAGPPGAHPHDGRARRRCARAAARCDRASPEDLLLGAPGEVLGRDVAVVAVEQVLQVRGDGRHAVDHGTSDVRIQLPPAVVFVLSQGVDAGGTVVGGRSYGNGSCRRPRRAEGSSPSRWCPLVTSSHLVTNCHRTPTSGPTFRTSTGATRETQGRC